MKAKLFTNLEDMEEQMFLLSHHFGFCHGKIKGCAKWCDLRQVRFDHPAHAEKWILMLPDRGYLKSDHLVDEAIDFDEDWLPSE